MERADRSSWRALGIVAACMAAAVMVVAGLLVCWVETANLDQLKAFDGRGPEGSLTSLPCGDGSEVAVATMDELRPAFAALKVVEGERGIRVILARQAVCRVRERQLSREIEEVRVELKIRTRLREDEQMTMVLNSVYFGDQLVGIESAAKHYFGRKLAALDAAEVAMLVGLIRSPGLYSPMRHPGRCLQRRNDVLEMMKRAGSLSASEAAAAEAEPLGVVQP